MRADPALRHRPQPGIGQKQKSNFEKLKNNWRPSGYRPETSSRSDARDGPRSPRRCHRAATVAAVPPLGGVRAVPSHDHRRCAPLPHTACLAAAVMFCATTEWRAITSTSATRAAASAHAAATAACDAASTRAPAPPPTRPPTRAASAPAHSLTCARHARPAPTRCSSTPNMPRLAVKLLLLPALVAASGLPVRRPLFASLPSHKPESPSWLLAATGRCTHQLYTDLDEPGYKAHVEFEFLPSTTMQFADAPERQAFEIITQDGQIKELADESWSYKNLALLDAGMAGGAQVRHVLSLGTIMSTHPCCCCAHAAALPCCRYSAAPPPSLPLRRHC